MRNGSVPTIAIIVGGIAALIACLLIGAGGVILFVGQSTSIVAMPDPTIDLETIDEMPEETNATATPLIAPSPTGLPATEAPEQAEEEAGDGETEGPTEADEETDTDPTAAPEPTSAPPTTAPTSVPATQPPATNAPPTEAPAQPTATPQPEATATPAPPEEGKVTNVAFSLASQTIGIDQRIPFSFSVTNPSEEEDLSIGYLGVTLFLPDGTQVGEFHTSWSGFALEPSQTLNWDDGYSGIGTPGEYTIALTICYPTKEACDQGNGIWEVISERIPITVQ